MKRKAIISMIVVLCMTFALTVPAMANNDDNYADAPQDEDGERPSVGETTLTGFDGTHQDGNWILSDGDDTDQTDNRRSDDVDIAVWAKIVDLGAADTIIYCIDIEWGNMKFVFGKDGGVWDPENRTYGTTDEGSWWENNYREVVGDADEFYLDGLNNRVTVTNRSNAGVDAVFDFTFNGENNNAFNKETTNDNRVVGNFFRSTMLGTDIIIQEVLSTAPFTGRDIDQITAAGEFNDLVAAVNDAIETQRNIALSTANTLAINASKILEDEGGSGSVQAQVEELAEFDILVAPENSLGIDRADNAGFLGLNEAFPFIDVLFAFSGTPDDDSELIGAAFTRVGVIIVTIIPQNDSDPDPEP